MPCLVELYLVFLERRCWKNVNTFFQWNFVNTCASVTLESNKDFVWKLRRNMHWDYFKKALKIVNTNCAIRSLELHRNPREQVVKIEGTNCNLREWVASVTLESNKEFLWKPRGDMHGDVFKKALKIVNTNFAIRSIELQFIPSSYNRNPRERVM